MTPTSPFATDVSDTHGTKTRVLNLAEIGLESQGVRGDRLGTVMEILRGIVPARSPLAEVYVDEDNTVTVEWLAFKDSLFVSIDLTDGEVSLWSLQNQRDNGFYTEGQNLSDLDPIVVEKASDLLAEMNDKIEEAKTL